MYAAAADMAAARGHPAIVIVHLQFFRNRVTLTFDLLTSGSMHAEILAIEHMCTKFGADRSSGFSCKAQTHIHVCTQ